MGSTHYCARCLTTFAGDPDACTNLSCGGPRPKKGWGVLLGAGDVLDRHYHIMKPLAVGGAGLTYLAMEVGDDGQPTPPELAIKVLYTARDSGPFLRRLSNEAQILQELAHANIVECRGFVHRTGHAPYLVTLFEHGGSLSGHIEEVGRLSPDIAVGILRQILLALDVAHQRGVVHRDLKPDNVLLNQKVDRDSLPYVRVTDFGIAKVHGGVGGRLTKVGAFIGTPEYAAPEQFEGTEPSPATDVFAAGGLLYYLCTGVPPVQFQHRMDIESSYDELLDQIPPRLPDSLQIDEKARAVVQELLDHMMLPSLGDRWTIQQILAAMDPLVKGGHSSALTASEAQQLGKGGRRNLPGNTFVTKDTDRGAPSRGTAPPPPAPSGDAPPPPPAPEEPPPVPEDTAPPPVPDEPPPVADAPAAPPPAPEPSREPDPAPKRRGGGLLAGGALMVVLLGGGALVVVLLVVAAVGFGWFSTSSSSAATTPVTTDPVEVTPAEPVMLTGATDPTLKSDLAGIQAALDAAAGDISKFCKARGRVPVELLIEADGSIASVEVDKVRVKDDDDRECLEKAIGRMTVPRQVAEPARALIAVEF